MITPPQSPSLGSTYGDERVVRFDNECVLIPESVLCSKRPKMITKSYSLPLWKKKGVQGAAAASDTELDVRVNEENHVILRVPVPSFMSKQPRSPTRVPEAQRLSPCLVRRKSNSPSRLSTTRRVSLPMSPRTDVITIPLRSCCDNCVHITEESLKEGVEWHEKFSRAARRKRSKSLDSTFGDAVTPSLTFSAKLALNVDEVDKRRHSREFKEEESPSSEHSEDGPQSSKETPRVSPIEEEDDDQLFPLPSPRRTPTSSPVPSPSTSTSCLAASSSHDSLSISARGSASSCEDSESRVRKGRYDNGLLTPDSSPSIPAHVPAALQQQQQQHRERLFQKPIPMPPMSTPPSPSSPWPRTSSSSPERKRRRSSFSLPTPTQFLKAGAEAIKGVGAIGSAAPSVRV